MRAFLYYLFFQGQTIHFNPRKRNKCKIIFCLITAAADSNFIEYDMFHVELCFNQTVIWRKNILVLVQSMDNKIKGKYKI